MHEIRMEDVAVTKTPGGLMAKVEILYSGRACGCSAYNFRWESNDWWCAIRYGGGFIGEPAGLRIKQCRCEKDIAISDGSGSYD